MIRLSSGLPQNRENAAQKRAAAAFCAAFTASVVNKSESRLDISVIVHIFKEHFQRSYPGDRLIMCLYIDHLFFKALVIPCNSENDIFAALKVPVSASYHDLPVGGKSSTRSAVYIFGSRCRNRFGNRFGNRFRFRVGAGSEQARKQARKQAQEPVRELLSSSCHQRAPSNC